MPIRNASVYIHHNSDGWAGAVRTPLGWSLLRPAFRTVASLDSEMNHFYAARKWYGAATINRRKLRFFASIDCCQQSTHYVNNRRQQSTQITFFKITSTIDANYVFQKTRVT